jgi:hypothetical protein
MSMAVPFEDHLLTSASPRTLPSLSRKSLRESKESDEIAPKERAKEIWKHGLAFTHRFASTRDDEMKQLSCTLLASVITSIEA